MAERPRPQRRAPSEEVPIQLQQQQQQGNTLFRTRGSNVVIRLDPTIAQQHTYRMFETGELPEIEADKISKMMEDTAVMQAFVNYIKLFNPQYTPWPVAAESYLTLLQVSLNKFADIYPIELGCGPDCDENELKENISKSVSNFKNFLRSTIAVSQYLTTLVSMSMPAKIRSNAVNEERTGSAMM
ncbi:MAG: hypothetical protein QXT27_01910 [Pyrobaculum sp.]